MANIRGLAEGERRRVFLKTTDAKFAGVIVCAAGSRTDQATLQPTATLCGRLLDAAGKPLTDSRFRFSRRRGRAPGVYFGASGTANDPGRKMERDKAIDNPLGDKLVMSTARRSQTTRAGSPGRAHRRSRVD